MDTPEDRYLGDGVYASFDGFNIRLDLRAQDPLTKIVLEPRVFKELNRYAEDVRRHYEKTSTEGEAS